MKKLLFIAALTTLTSIATAMAQPYPSRPITIIVPFPAGGPVDTLARLLAEPMRVSLGQPLILENVGGAGGTIAAARVARAAPDGYTMIIGNWTSFVGTPAVYPVQFDVIKDFAPVSLLAISQLMVVGRKTLPPNNVKELIAWLKANPGKATSGTIGVGSPSQVGGRLHDLGQEIPPCEQQTPEALGAYHKAEIGKWWPIIKAAGLKAE